MHACARVDTSSAMAYRFPAGVRVELGGGQRTAAEATSGIRVRDGVQARLLELTCRRDIRHHFTVRETTPSTTPAAVNSALRRDDETDHTGYANMSMRWFYTNASLLIKYSREAYPLHTRTKSQSRQEVQAKRTASCYFNNIIIAVQDRRGATARAGETKQRPRF